MLCQLSYGGKEIGALGRQRSDNLTVKSRLLCRLSYERRMVAAPGDDPGKHSL